MQKKILNLLCKMLPIEVLTTAYLLEAGFGSTDGSQRNEDHLERVSSLTYDKMEGTPGLL